MLYTQIQDCFMPSCNVTTYNSYQAVLYAVAKILRKLVSKWLA